MIKRRTLAPQAANFSRDMGPLATRSAQGMLALAAVAVVLTGTLLYETASLRAAIATSEARVTRLTAEIAATEAATADAPALPVFTALADRVQALNDLDYGAIPSVGGLLDALEATLPDDAVLTNIDYDRNKGLADLVAVSPRSAELTRLFDVLYGHAMFRKVQLIDKKLIATAGATHTQVNLVLDVKPAAPAADKSRKSGERS